MKFFALISIAMIAASGFMPTNISQQTVGTAGVFTAICVALYWWWVNNN